MVGMGLIMVAVSWIGLLLIWRGRLESARWFLWAAFLSFPTGFIAVLCGWYTAEVGRQPWVIYHILRTEDAITPSLTAGDVLFSLIAYILVYVVIYAYGLTYIYRLLRRGPAAESEATRQLPGRPIAAALQGSEQ
jgi:cytochrome d ubiquinol oxidase subunit I